MPSVKPEVGTPVVMIDTGLNSLANGAAVASSTPYDNSPGTNGYLWADFELVLAAQGSNRAATPIVGLFIEAAPDGFTFETALNRNAHAGTFIPSASSSAAQRLVLKRVSLPATTFHVRVENQTGQAFAASLSSITMHPVRIRND